MRTVCVYVCSTQEESCLSGCTPCTPGPHSPRVSAPWDTKVPDPSVSFTLFLYTYTDITDDLIECYAYCVYAYTVREES